ncbi:hypothetical protein BofuT4_uP122360.1 [Botrytis cinerea T4]|uniref:Uncharacterized protein n=1 Tax=Botryotinia fuckeliana (strain T4) TaxID=999810 RepID=G2YNL9_BOTF4|nr:hypothetical protein BofuT4_uP122360.1 [Botrytis cinerea T4]
MDGYETDFYLLLYKRRPQGLIRYPSICHFNRCEPESLAAQFQPFLNRTAVIIHLASHSTEVSVHHLPPLAFRKNDLLGRMNELRV